LTLFLTAPNNPAGHWSFFYNGIEMEEIVEKLREAENIKTIGTLLSRWHVPFPSGFVFPAFYGIKEILKG